MADCCPFCGAELDVAAQRCRDCNLSQEPGAAPPLIAEEVDNEVAYEVTDWPVGSRLRLTAVLAERGIPWRWEPVLNLIVAEDDDAAAEEVLDEVEAEEMGDAGTSNGEASAPLAPEVLHDDDPDDEDDVAEDAGLEYDDEDDLDLFGANGEGDDEDDDEDGADEDDGAVAQAAMADLFVAADRLMHEPDNMEIAVELESAAEIIETSAPPFGIEDTVWERIRELAASVEDALDQQDPTAVESIDSTDVEIEPDTTEALEDEPSAEDSPVDDVGGDDVGGEVSEADEVVAVRAQVLRDALRPWV